ncbi:MAG: AAA family ATPase [Pirellulaceae bacterium]|nr:AAA family ATPase [Planctomycetales bacterium]
MTASQSSSTSSSDQRLADLIARLNTLGGPTSAGPSGAPGQGDADPTLVDPSNPFVPWVPESLGKANLTENEVEALLLKFLMARGTATGHESAQQLKLPFRLVEPLIRAMKSEQIIIYKSSTSSGDYVLQLSDMGRERARRYVDVSTYFGSAPVSLRDYAFAVAAQSIQHQKPRERQLKEAFKDLAIPAEMLLKLGPAISAGKGMFLYGYPGNGKTSIAERVTRAFGPTIWIPRAIGVDGEIIRLFDPVSHEEVPLPRTSPILQETNVDQRWIRIKRPTVIVGGELTMDQLEISFNRTTGIGEAPIQMKANCGTLVIDDFGRQRISTAELLNRWIVPLEKSYDFLNTLSGKKIQVPFDELVIFSTNLEPRDLVDDAFLRRIPYKIEVRDPSEEQFRGLFRIMCPKFGLEYRDEMMTYLIQKHYSPSERPFRYCHPRDLLLQIKFYCDYLEQPMEMTPRSLDFAAENYFSVV